MITKYFTSLSSTFNPLSAKRAHKIPRLIQAFLAADARSAAGGNIKIESVVLPSTSTAPSVLSVVFKDGKQLKFTQGVENAPAVDNRLDLNKLDMKDVVDELDRHSRTLQRKDALSSG